MNKHFLIAWVTVFVIWMIGSFVVHGFFLSDQYAQLPNLYRTEADTQAYMHLMLLAHVLLAGGFVWIFQNGHDERAWIGQGLRFGIAIAVFAPIPTYLTYFIVQPMPAELAIGQAIGDTVLVIVLGLVTAFIYRNARPARA